MHGCRLWYVFYTKGIFLAATKKQTAEETKKKFWTFLVPTP